MSSGCFIRPLPSSPCRKKGTYTPKSSSTLNTSWVGSMSRYRDQNCLNCCFQSESLPRLHPDNNISPPMLSSYFAQEDKCNTGHNTSCTVLLRRARIGIVTWDSCTGRASFSSRANSRWRPRQALPFLVLVREQSANFWSNGSRPLRLGAIVQGQGFIGKW